MKQGIDRGGIQRRLFGWFQARCGICHPMHWLHKLGSLRERSAGGRDARKRSQNKMAAFHTSFPLGWVGGYRLPVFLTIAVRPPEFDFIQCCTEHRFNRCIPNGHDDPMLVDHIAVHSPKSRSFREVLRGETHQGFALPEIRGGLGLLRATRVTLKYVNS